MFDPEPAREILARVIDGTMSTVDAAHEIADRYNLPPDTVGPIVGEARRNDADLDYDDRIDWAVDSVRGSVEVSQLPPNSTPFTWEQHTSPQPTLTAEWGL